MNPLQPDYQFLEDADGQKILTLFSSALDAARQLGEAWPERAAEPLERLHADLLQLDALCRGNAALLERSFYAAQMENVRFTLDLIKAAIEKEDAARAASLANDQLRCFLLELRRKFIFGHMCIPGARDGTHIINRSLRRTTETNLSHRAAPHTRFPFSCLQEISWTIRGSAWKASCAKPMRQR